MATNFVYEKGNQLELTVDSGVVSGDPVLIGGMGGVALTDRDTTTGKATVKFDGVPELSIKAVDDAGNSAIALGDALYFNSADTPKISKKSSGTFFGWALEAVSAGSTATKQVRLPQGSAAVGAGNLTALFPADQALLVRNETGGSLSAGDLVYVSGWDETNSRWQISKADADAAGAKAQFVMRGTLANNTNGQAFRTYRTAATQNTNGATEGDPVYLHTTAGGWTLSAPTGADDIVQIVGRVAVVSATVGVVEFDLLSNNTAQIGTNELQAGAVTAAKIASDAVETAKIANDAVTTAKILDANVTTAKVADDAITKAKLAGGFLKGTCIAGGAAGDHTVTGIASGDELVLVARLDRDGTAANIDITAITSEFTITGANTINNAAGTNTTGDSLLVLYIDLT